MSRVKVLAICGATALLLALAGGCSSEPEAQPMRHYTFRAIGGASMGAMTAAQLGLRHHELFDIIAPSGGGLDLPRLIRFFREGMLGGFCVPPEVGRMCRAPGQTQDYEHMDCGGPSGGGFDREDMFKNFKDMFIAYGNLGSFNPAHPYLPAGLTADYLARSNTDKCQNPVRITGMYDWEFNPEGAYPAITYCEADGPEQGLFDPSVPPRYPVEILLAVDLNDNGVRDSGEPMLFRLHERFDDVGLDGVPSAGEPGYDPASNPDPAGDDYDLMANPLGTEDNAVYDLGEPYLDYGLDGVAGTADSPYDWGEGNGHFDYNPHVLRSAVMFDPSRLVRELSGQELDRLDFYIDVGIRDHLGFCPSSEAFAGILGSRGRPPDVRHGYEELLREDWTLPYDIHGIDWKNLGRDLLVLYGNPDATQAEIDAGDGGHVGNIAQVAHRIFSILAYVSYHWPDGDFEPVEPYTPATMLDTTMYSDILGQERQYYLLLPPGYEQSPDERFPVLYLVHGIGMSASDLTAMSLLADPWMAEGSIQKFIIVFPDAECQDDCFSGTFMANQLGRDKPPRRYEDFFFQEFIPFIDRTYRTRAAEDRPVPAAD